MRAVTVQSRQHFTVGYRASPSPWKESPCHQTNGRLGARGVLLVQDGADVRRTLRLSLESDGHDLHETEDGITALAEARDFRPVAFIGH